MITQIVNEQLQFYEIDISHAHPNHTHKPTSTTNRTKNIFEIILSL